MRLRQHNQPWFCLVEGRFHVPGRTTNPIPSVPGEISRKSTVFSTALWYRLVTFVPPLCYCESSGTTLRVRRACFPKVGDIAMASLTPSTFVRRPTGNRTTESTCSRCSLTVATARHEKELDQAEQSHVCEPWLLEQWNQMFESNPGRHAVGNSGFTPALSSSPAQVSDRRFCHAEKPPVRPRPVNSNFAEFRRRTFPVKSTSL